MRSVLARFLIALLFLTAVLPASLSPMRTAAAAAGEPTNYRKEKLHPKLREQVDAAAADAQFTVVIKGRDRARLDGVMFRHDDAVAALKAAAARSQGPIVSHLQARGAQVLRQFWLIDAVVARVDKPTLQSLVNLDQVDLVYDNFRVSAPPVQLAAGPSAAGELTWGLEKIQADQVWSGLGVTGQGVRVAVLDTGVDIKHPDIAGKMASDNPGDPSYPGGWIEFADNGTPVSGSTPHDSAAHGTHTSGTVVGGNAGGTHIGVAPGATLMHGLVLPGGGGSFAQVVAGMEWAVAPTDAAGNPAGHPANIASMSFGADGLRSEVLEPIRNMYAAGVLPIAAIGNCGASCVGSPGAVYEAFAIGASAEDDSIAEFSSGGVIPKSGWENPPDSWPDQWVKPNLSAPGVNVMSSVPGGGYEYWDGTSMATPHAAGTAALMLSANPALTPDAVLSTLGETAFWDARYGDERPNIRFGMGRINAYDAVARIAYNSGITGVVTDRGSGTPLDQAEVAVEGSNRSTHTKADGSFSLLLPPGTYTLKVSRFGYGAATISNVAVTDGKLTKADAGLAALPSGTVSGQVKYDRTGIGIPGATVRVKGIPIKIAAETDAEGNYSLKLPVGAYDLDFSAFGFGTVQAGGVAVSDTAPAVQDATLQSLPRVFVIGDFDDQLAGFLRASGYLADAGGMEVVQHLSDYSAVIFNMAPKLTEKEFRELVDSAERNGVGLLFTKGYWYGWGIDLLRDYYGDPAVSESNWYPVELNGRVEAEHPDLLPGRAVGDLIPILPAGFDMGYFSGYSGQTVLSLTNSMADNIGGGVAYRQNAGNRHVLLASFGVLPWQGPAQWTPEAREIFRNAVRWAAKPETSGPRYVLWNLKATPDTVLWSEPVTVSVGVKNIGDGAGTTDLAISVNDMPEPAQSFTLYPGRYAEGRFAVQREPVGAYKVKAGPLAATFRVRPPKVSVSAQTIYLPPSGKGRNADPGEPAIPLAGAQVDVVKGGQVISRGKLDQDGALTFDSTASKADYTLVVRHTGYGYNTRRSYLLTLPVHVEADSTYAFAPQASGAAQLDVALTAKDPSHHGSLFVAGGTLGQAAYEFPAGAPLVATPGSYQLATVMAWDVPGAQWAYVGDWSAMNLVAGRQAYTFGGDLRLSMADVRGQQAPKPSVTWGMSDAYSHSLSAIYRVTAGAFGPAHNRVLTDRAAWPATVAATAQDAVRPVLTLTNPAGAIEQTGPISWAERPRAIAFDTATVATGDYSVLLQSDTGPYMGQLQAAAKLMLPARAVSRTLLMPGDTFDVTVVFDAGSAGDLTLTETLPAGFAIVRQSSNPNSDFRGATWTWHASGRGAYRPGQTIRVTYTVQVGRDVPAGMYSLTGAVAQGGGSRLVAGPQAVQVVR